MTSASIFLKHVRHFLVLLSIVLLAAVTLDAQSAFAAKKLTPTQKAAGAACTQKYNSCEAACKRAGSDRCAATCVNEYDKCLTRAQALGAVTPPGPTTTGTYEQAPAGGASSPKPGNSGPGGF